MEFSSVIIFDSNVLYINYDKGGDFTKFYFNRTFDNLIDYIQEIDMYEHISLMIPNVVWNEMKKQKIDAFDIKSEELKNKLTKINLPNLIVNETVIDYSEYLEKEIVNYKNLLADNLINISDLELPSMVKFSNIINRAFEKRSPFEGKMTKSDKGFKDALLWESILELKEKDPSVRIIFYCKDGKFDNTLKEEYESMYDDEIEIFNNEQDVLSYIDKLAAMKFGVRQKKKKLEEAEISKIRNFISSKDFRTRLITSFQESNIFSDFFVIEDINIINVNNIVSNINNDHIYYELNLDVSIMLNRPDGTVSDIIEKTKPIQITIPIVNDEIGKMNFDFENTYFEEE